MKKFIPVFIAVVAFASCSTPKAEEVTNFVAYGDSTFTTTDAISAAELVANMKGDTMYATVAGDIAQVCKTKGCWMSTTIDEERELFISYDYEFLLPTDCDGQNMVMTGYAYYDTLSVEYLQHLAEDAGKSQEEIDAITEPKADINFMATGVKIILPSSSEE